MTTHNNAAAITVEGDGDVVVVRNGIEVDNQRKESMTANNSASDVIYMANGKTAASDATFMDNGDMVVTKNSTKVEIHTDGSVDVFTNNKVTTYPLPANDTAIAAAQVAPSVGREMPDHSVYAGLTADGKQQIFAMPTDLSPDHSSRKRSTGQIALSGRASGWRALRILSGFEGCGERARSGAGCPVVQGGRLAARSASCIQLS